MFDQEDNQTHYRTDEFIFGDKILVCPIQEPNSKGRRMYIPRGQWYNYWTDELVEGGKEKWVDAEIDSMPLFVLEGAIIPKFPVQQYVDEKQIDEVTLDIYYKEGKERSQLFDDAHDGYDYTKGRYSLRTFKLTGKSNELIIQQHKEGKYITNYKNFKLNIHGLPFKAKVVQLDNVIVPTAELITDENGLMIVDKDFSEIHITG